MDAEPSLPLFVVALVIVGFTILGFAFAYAVAHAFFSDDP